MSEDRKQVTTYGDGEGLYQEIFSTRSGWQLTSQQNREEPTEDLILTIYCLLL